MKKKGLIVATIVMVLVLAVSLTTATYAWFTTVSRTTVESIDFSVGADSDVNIGLLKNHTLNASGNTTNATIDNTKSAASFMWGNMTYTDGQWTNGTDGLGYMVDTTLSLNNMKRAVGTGVPDTSVDHGTWVATNSIITAEAGDNSNEGKNATAAVMQTDYLDVIFGVNASKTDVTEIQCVVTVNPTVGAVLGMNAAIHVRWSLDGTNYYDCDIYDPTNAQADAAKAAGAIYSQAVKNDYSKSISVGGAAITKNGNHDGYEAGAGYLGQEIAVNQGWASITIPVVKAANSSTALEANAIPTQIHLQIYIAGYDTDCNNNAMGVASEILINFIGVKVTSTP